MKFSFNKGLTKIILAAFFLFLVFKSISISELKAELRNLNLFYFSLFIFISLPMIWASCVKWSLFLQEKVHILSLMRLYTISYFVNLFAPSTFGGDVVRSIGLGKKIDNHAKALMATFYERLTGLLMMLLLSAVSLILRQDLLEAFGVSTLIVLILCLVFGGLFFVRPFRLSLIAIMEKVVALLPSLKIKPKVESFLSQLKEEIHIPVAVLLKSFFWAVVFHILTVVNTYLAGLSIGVSNLDFLSLSAVVPMVLLILVVPLTPGGLGVQESAFVFLLSLVGIAPSQAFLISLLLRIKNLLLAGIGGLMLLATARK